MNFSCCLFALSFALVRTRAQGRYVSLSLDGEEWTALNSNGSIQIDASVPGSIYTDLMRAGVIGDPYYRDNDVLFQWIGRDNWTFSRSFDCGGNILSEKKRILLVTHGIDTISNVTLNGKIIGTTRNMFTRYTFDIKSVLSKQNNISIAIESPVNYAKLQHEKQLINYLIPPTCPPPAQNGECHVNYIRKSQCSFSWDWGPSFPTQGIWKHIEVIGFDSLVVRDITVRTTLIKSVEWELEVRVYFETAATEPLQNVLTFIYLDQYLVLNTTQNIVPDNSSSADVSFVIRIPQVPIELWWPNGLGSQKLYALKVQFTSNSETITKMIKIGFREVELVQEPVKNSPGLSFYFKANGMSFFAKGSNWIPADSFPERVTPEYLRLLLQSAKDANINVLRVWGGGYYESDLFYEIADEMGILIWQDLMFAVALYPTNTKFLYSVAIEMQQQVRRLQHHPSILVWAGNNENEQGLAQRWWPEVSQMFNQYKSDYIKLYINTIMPIVKENDPTRAFLSSSPSNGEITEDEGWISTNPQNFSYGDVHFYSYSIDSWDWASYPRARFISEYGFQSYPSFENLAMVSEPSDWTFPFSKFLNHRQHQTLGNIYVQLMIIKHLPFPSPKCGQQGFQDLLYLSQIAQAMSIKTETEMYRRSQSVIEDGFGKTMGALYWQLNDIWQGASWSSIEYGGKWKILHYYVMDFFAPVLVSPYLENGTVKVSVVSDLIEKITNMTLTVTVFHWASLVPSYTEPITFNQPPLMAQSVYAKDVDKILNFANCSSSKNCFVYFELYSSKKFESRNFLLLSEPKDSEGVRSPKIRVTNITGPFETNVSNFTFNISLHTSAIAPFVYLDIPTVPGRFCCNGFIMVKDKTVMFYSKHNVTSNKIREKITIKSLSDVCR